ncbi:YceI family protein [Flavobacteriaceae bacterium TP-CH-4]|uniref:YceI family protein n=1 Tax=Pelagihabitans pacificus TaxID=2696054 RepID=A0A967E8A5_9FLAO|nr:YceI family protein [Pelagihabitans pacificus]NHF61470.1 YceI family protein [Pelagihabitans pacificus]
MKKIGMVLFLLSGTMVCGQGSYTLGSESTLTIDGTSTLHDWTVTANTMEGTINEEGQSIKAITFEVAVADILSDRGATMDKKMHDALKKEEHPKVSFSVTDARLSEGESQDINGHLTIAGVGKDVKVPSKISKTDGTLRIVGEKKIVLQDYNMEPPTAMFGSIVVGDDVIVKFDLVFERN